MLDADALIAEAERYFNRRGLCYAPSVLRTILRRQTIPRGAAILGRWGDCLIYEGDRIVRVYNGRTYGVVNVTPLVFKTALLIYATHMAMLGVIHR
jgi:hypothetical protein